MPADFVEYERVSGAQTALPQADLRRSCCASGAGSRPRAASSHIPGAGRQLLEKFATYCALDEHLHCRNPQLWIWPEWPAEYQDPDSAETRAFATKTLAQRDVLSIPAVADRSQLRAAQQHARERGCSASGSITISRWPPTASAPTCGRTGRFSWRAAAWDRRPTIFRRTDRIGAFRRPMRERHREDGYRLFAESIRKNCRHGGALRIDHVMRLFRLYWIPDGWTRPRRLRREQMRRFRAHSGARKRAQSAWSLWAKIWAPWNRRCAKRWRASAF